MGKAAERESRDDRCVCESGTALRPFRCAGRSRGRRRFPSLGSGPLGIRRVYQCRRLPVAIVDLVDRKKQIETMKTAFKRKNVYLDEGKIRRAQRILGTQTDAETIDRALDLVVFRKEILRSLEQTAGKGWGGKNADLESEFVGWDRLSDEVLMEFEKSLA